MVKANAWNATYSSAFRLGSPSVEGNELAIKPGAMRAATPAASRLLWAWIHCLVIWISCWRAAIKTPRGKWRSRQVVGNGEKLKNRKQKNKIKETRNLLIEAQAAS